MTRTATIATNLTLPPDDGVLLPANSNHPPADDPFDAVRQEIDDLFDEACVWADGQPIEDDATHDAVTKIYDMMHDAGKRASVLHRKEKDPLDKQVAAVQAKWNPLIQDKKGKVALAKSALSTLLAAYRQRKADEAAAEARRIAAIAAAEAEAARAALQASAGNLEARVEAEQQVEQAKVWGAAAKRADKAATVGLGLRTVWLGTVEDWEKAMDWAWERDAGRFRELVQGMVDSAVHGGVRAIPGVRVWDEKRAT